MENLKWTLVMVLICCWTMTVIGLFIEVKKNKMMGEDTVLSRELRRRMTCSQDMLLKEVPKQFQLYRSAEQKRNITRRAPIDFTEPPRLRLKMRIIDLIRHSIYESQYRLMDLHNFTEDYSHRDEYRVGMLYATVDRYIKEMRIIFTILYRRIEESSHSVHWYMIYYTHTLRKNIDVTYLVEEMIKLHTSRQSVRQKNATEDIEPTRPTNQTRQEEHINAAPNVGEPDRPERPAPPKPRNRRIGNKPVWQEGSGGPRYDLRHMGQLESAMLDNIQSSNSVRKAVFNTGALQATRMLPAENPRAEQRKKIKPLWSARGNRVMRVITSTKQAQVAASSSRAPARPRQRKVKPVWSGSANMRGAAHRN